MKILELTYGEAVIESDAGLYRVGFDAAANGQLREIEIIDFTAYPHSKLSNDHDDEHPDEIEDDIFFLLNEAIENAREEEENNEDNDEIVLLIKNKAGRYSVRFETELMIDDMPIKKIMIGSYRYLRHILKPLNSTISTYLRSTREPKEEVVERLVIHFLKSLNNTLLLENSENSDDIIRYDNLVISSKIDDVEKNSAKLWIASTLLADLEETSNRIIKECLIDTPAGNWLRVSTQEREQFDIVKFKQNHPELYEKYKTKKTAVYLFKSMTAKKFPLEENALRLQIASAFELVDKN